MYSILLSKIQSLVLIKEKYNNILKPNSKVAALPWTFPNELDAEKLENEFFNKNGERYNRYIQQLRKFGIDDSNVIVCNCYSQNSNELCKIIDNSDVLLLPGGNPEMLMNKIMHKTELLYKIKYYTGIIIGESAGAITQLERYFITAKNNFYGYTAFYDGIGILKDQFLLDVHSENSEDYMKELEEISKKANKKVYAIFDNGAIVYNRRDNKIDFFGDIKEIDSH